MTVKSRHPRTAGQALGSKLGTRQSQETCGSPER